MRIKFNRMNFETQFYYDMATGKGFLINDMPYADVDKSIRNEEGPRSPMYGTTYGDTNEFMDRYHCKCGKTVGAAFEGELCPLCNTPIEFHEPSITMTGWLNLSQYHIMIFVIYSLIAGTSLKIL